MLMIGSSVDYVRSGGMRNVPVTKALSLIRLKSRFGETRGLFWDGSLNFEPLSGDEDDTSAVSPLPKLQDRTHGRTFGHYVSFNVQQARYAAATTCELARNRPHTVESGFEPEILQPRNQGLAIRLPRPPCSCKLHGIHRQLTPTLAFRILKPRCFLQS
ncbi:hypothetical protein AVEN_224371-1 [Araneus ventricosus]|uniref:Uncharacterized protein n=1 Tax=Araneus ventricosus TaxID=182803 RepID=A0A4Y2TEZ3_ARAVE|nr:hypothetical protein AVEN_224371-1 [Araneus ventricosus]